MKTGIVVKTTGNWHTVKTEHERVNCILRGSFRTHNLKNTNPIAVGDEVSIELTGHGKGVITEINKRRNYIIRKSTNLSKEAQIIAANIDQAILMFTLDYPKTPLEFVDRFLVAAEAYHIRTILLVNKIDLYSESQMEWLNEVKRIYEHAGYTIEAISVSLGQNIDAVKELLKNKLTLIAGNSGIGKSSLINYISPSANLKTNEISTYHQAGKHTTTYPEMVELSAKTFIIDSPGIRGFGLTDLEKNEIGLYFVDIFRISKNCQFYNCSHIHEPNCAVMEAFKQGVLHESRYRSYFNIYNDTSQKYRTS